MSHFVAFFAGAFFAAGLAIGGMTDANKVLAFLNLAGSWDPSLAFVMVGAIGVHLPLYELASRGGRPWLATSFERAPSAIDARLIGGAAIFGVGWGMSGLCLGPALVSLATGEPSVVVFVVGVTTGMAAWNLAGRWLGLGGAAPE